MISSQGYLMDCRDTPFSDEEIAQAGTVAETRNGNTTVIGKDGDNSNGNDSNDNAANTNTDKKRDAVNQTGMHKRSDSGEES